MYALFKLCVDLANSVAVSLLFFSMVDLVLYVSLLAHVATDRMIYTLFCVGHTQLIVSS